MLAGEIIPLIRFKLIYCKSTALHLPKTWPAMHSFYPHTTHCTFKLHHAPLALNSLIYFDYFCIVGFFLGLFFFFNHHTFHPSKAICVLCLNASFSLIDPLKWTLDHWYWIHLSWWSFSMHLFISTTKNYIWFLVQYQPITDHSVPLKYIQGAYSKNCYFRDLYNADMTGFHSKHEISQQCHM